MLEAIIIDPKNIKAERSIIFLHGLGADGNDFVSIVRSFGLNFQQDYKVRFIFPHAPSMPVSLNNNYIMPAWFDIYSLDKNSREDNIGIEKTRLEIEKLISHEHINNGIAYENIVLAGFSQGGVIALYTALKFSYKLAGVMGLSCYLPRFDQNYSNINKDLKIFLAHGYDDQVVQYAFGQAANERLTKQDYKVSWHSYNMQHSVCAAEIADMANYLRRVFG